jgi:hypothetical protein
VNQLGRDGRNIFGVPTIATPHTADDPTLGYEPETGDVFDAWIRSGQRLPGAPGPGAQNAGAWEAQQTARAQTANLSQPPPVGVPRSASTSSPLLSAAGQQAPTEAYNYQPMGDGSWTMHPPGVDAPLYGVQGSFPDMASAEQLQGLGGALKRQFGTQPTTTAAPAPAPASPGAAGTTPTAGGM